MASDTKPHDAFFKEVFGRPALAADLLRRVLPPELVAAIDLDRHERLTGPTASALATVALLFLKHGPYAQPIEPHLMRWLGHLRGLADQPGGRDALTVAFRYLLEVNESAEPRKLGDLLEPQLGTETKELMMTFMERAREEGRAEEGRSLLFKLLTMKYHHVPPHFAAQVERASLADIERWAGRTLSVDHIEDVFAP